MKYRWFALNFTRDTKSVEILLFRASAGVSAVMKRMRAAKVLQRFVANSETTDLIVYAERFERRADALEAIRAQNVGTLGPWAGDRGRTAILWDCEGAIADILRDFVTNED